MQSVFEKFANIVKRYSTVKTLLQYYLFFPLKHKECYMAYLLNEFAGNSVIVFTRTCNDTQRLAIMLRNLGLQAIPLHGQMEQAKRLGALEKFKEGKRNILVATDVASRYARIRAADFVRSCWPHFVEQRFGYPSRRCCIELRCAVIFERLYPPRRSYRSCR